MILLHSKLNSAWIETSKSQPLRENVWKSPLEHQKYVKEGIGEIKSNQSNLRLNLCVSQVSSVIPS